MSRPPDPDAAIVEIRTPDVDASVIPTGMVLVPAGPFVMGSDRKEGTGDERPEHVVTLGAFYLDVHEVTNAEWRACTQAHGCTPLVSTDTITRKGYSSNSTYDGYPVVNVTREQASAYCAWQGKRLPSEAEWEKAARGGCELVAPATCGPEDERTYPWGEAAPTCALANFSRSASRSDCVAGGDTDAVGARSPAGDSPYGAQDMAGNVAEWVTDWYSSSYYASSPSADPPGPRKGERRVARGGSWSHVANRLRVGSRHDVEALYVFGYVGLRCALSSSDREGPPLEP